MPPAAQISMVFTVEDWEMIAGTLMLRACDHDVVSRDVAQRCHELHDAIERRLAQNIAPVNPAETASGR